MIQVLVIMSLLRVSEESSASALGNQLRLGVRRTCRTGLRNPQGVHPLPKGEEAGSLWASSSHIQVNYSTMTHDLSTPVEISLPERPHHGDRFSDGLDLQCPVSRKKGP